MQSRRLENGTNVNPNQSEEAARDKSGNCNYANISLVCGILVYALIAISLGLRFIVSADIQNHVIVEIMLRIPTGLALLFSVTAVVFALSSRLTRRNNKRGSFGRAIAGLILGSLYLLLLFAFVVMEALN